MRRAAPPAPRVSVAPRVVARHVSARATQHTFPLPMRTPLCRPPPSLHFACRFSTASPPSNPTPQPAQAPPASAQSAPASKGDITPERWTEKNEAVFREIADLLHDNKHFQEITRRFGAEHVLLEEPMWALANSFMAQRKMTEAVQCWKRIAFLEEKWHGVKDPLVARAHLFLAQTYVLMDRIIDAEKENATFMEMYKNLPADPEVKKDAAISRKISGEILCRREKYDEANRVFEDILTNWISYLSPQGRVMVLEAHATSYEGMEKYDLAIEILQLSRQFIRTHIGANSPEAVRAEQALSRCWQAKGMRMKALEHAEAALVISQKTLGEDDQFTVTSRLHIADALMLLDNDKEAEEHLNAVIKVLKEVRKNDPLLPSTQQTLATAQLKQGKAEEAEKTLVAAITNYQKQKGVHELAIQQAKELLEKARLMNSQRVPQRTPRDPNQQQPKKDAGSVNN